MALDTGSIQAGEATPSKYKTYAGRDVKSTQVDWSGQAKTISDELSRIQTERQAERTRLEKQAADNMEKINSIEPGADNNLNSKILQFSNQAGSQSMDMLDFLKRGIINPTDYQVFTSNQKQSVASMANAVKNYNTSFEEYEKRMQEGVSSSAETTYAQSLNGFGKVSNMEFVSDPVTGYASVVILTDEEKASGEFPDPNKFPERYIPANQLNQRMNQKVNKVDILEASAKPVEAIGQTISQYMTEEKIVSQEDFFLRDDAKEMIRDYAKSIAGSGNQMLSVLVDSVQGKYVKSDGSANIIFSEEDRADNPDAILVRVDSSGVLVPQFTDEQEEDALQYTENIIKAQLDDKLEVKQTRAETSTEAGDRKQTEKVAGYIGNANKLQTANDKQFDLVARDIITDVNSQAEFGDNKIENITRNADEFIIKIKDPSGNIVTERIPRTKKDKDGKPVNLSMEEVTQGLIRYIAPKSQIGDQSFDAMVDTYKETGGAFEGDISSESAEAGVGFKEVSVFSYTPEDVEVFEDPEITEPDQVVTAASTLLNSKLRKLGMQGTVTFEDSFGIGAGDDVTISVPGQTPVVVNLSRSGDNKSDVLAAVKQVVETAREVYNAEGGVKKSGGTTTSSGGNVR